MSRIGKMPVPVPQGTQVQILTGLIKAKGPHGELQEFLPSNVKAELKDGNIVLTADLKTSRDASAIYGTTRARVANMVQGVHAGFVKVLDVVGLGFKALVTGDKLTLNIGFSHPTEFLIPKGVKIVVDPKSVQITVAGPSKEMVGAVAAAIRSLKPPEPYKGTGIRYFGEHIIRKAGKTAAGAGAGPGSGGAKK